MIENTQLLVIIGLASITLLSGVVVLGVHLYEEYQEINQ